MPRKARRRSRLAQARRCGLAIALGGLAFADVGCPTHRRGPPPPPPQSGGAASSDAILQEMVTVERQPSETRYHGQDWTLTVNQSAGWQRVSEDTTATLKLTREANGVVLHMALKAYPVRSAMPVETFLAAHAMWMSEEGGPRIEYEYDEESGSWRGYAIHGDEETYYAFCVADDRAYVIEESATGGVLDGDEVARFYRVAESFQPQAQGGLEPTPLSDQKDPPEDP